MDTRNDDSLSQVRQSLLTGNCGRAIQEMDAYLAAWPEPQTAEKLMLLRENYDRMADFWLQGGKDPELDTQYRRLLQQMYVLYANVAHHHRMKASPYQYSLYTRTRQGQHDWTLTGIRKEMEDFVSSAALLQLEPEHTRQQAGEALYRRHQQRMSQLFEYVLTSRQWTESVGSQFADMLVSPTIDTVDQQLIVAAVSLSLMNQFDMAKFRMLAAVYQQSQDEAVRQRALVGWVFGLQRGNPLVKVYPEMREIAAQVMAHEGACTELTELQLQLIYCLNEEKDTNTIRHEIIPDIMKNNDFRLTLNGLEEKEDDPMEEILHPDAADRRMEQLEKNFRRMSDMQKQGSDIFFGGFSQLKRLPFFYDISNWLSPFYLQHPDIAQTMKQLQGNRFIEGVVSQGPFCDSDKYSFVIAFKQVAEHLPDHIVEMMKRGEASLAGELQMSDDYRSPAYLRRLYLMDLYRFFRLFPHREELYNPFDGGTGAGYHGIFFTAAVLGGSPLDKHKPDVVRLLLKQHCEEMADSVLQSFPAAMHDAQYYLWTGNYDEVLRMDADNVKALQGRARRRFEAKQYHDALADYDRLLLLRPEKPGYQLSKAICLVQLKSYAEALQLLFRLDYEHPDDKNIGRVLAWTLMNEGKLEQAAKTYSRLTADGDEAAREDRTHYGYCLWLQGRVKEAADALKGCAGLDDEWLREQGLSDAEISIMAARISA